MQSGLEPDELFRVAGQYVLCTIGLTVYCCQPDETGNLHVVYCPGISFITVLLNCYKPVSRNEP